MSPVFVDRVHGSDEKGDGSIDKPFRTLGRALGIRRRPAWINLFVIGGGLALILFSCSAAAAAADYDPVFDSLVALVLFVVALLLALATLGQVFQIRKVQAWIERHCRWLELEATWKRWLP